VCALAAETVTEETFDAVQAGLDELQPELLRRANAELLPDRPEPEHNAGRRGPMLAWFSGREEVPAGDVLEWAKEQVRAILTEHGSFPAFAASAEAQRVARRAADDAQAEHARQVAAEWATRSDDTGPIGT
jgi:hypothetical protein